MYAKKKKKGFRIILILVVGLLLTLGALLPIQGQGETILTIASPAWMGDVFRPELFENFEAEHGVKVVVVGDDGDWYGSALDDLDAAMEKWTEHASIADVVYLPSWLANPFSTRAGLWLDLKPLIAADADIDVDDFYPAVWEAFAWDGGQWALPVTGDVQFFVYDKLKFDEAGLSYPNEAWTFDDVVNAARALTVYEADGDVELPGIGGYGMGTMLAAFGGVQSLVNDGTLTPNFQPFASFLEEYAAFQQEMIVEGQYDYDAVPFHISSPWQLTNSFSASETPQEWHGALLPNISAIVDANGFAVSAGTLYPELSYELAKYLTSDPTVVTRFFANSPARKSLVGVEPPEDGDSFFTPQAIDPEVQALIDEAMTKGIPHSRLLFEDFLYGVVSEIIENDADPTVALQDAEAKVIQQLDTVTEMRQSVVVAVATPIPTPVVGSGQIVLKFGGIDASYQPDGWDQVLEDFTAANPNIATVEVTNQFFSTEDFNTQDCLFVSGNYVGSQGVEAELLPLDPFLDADPAFDSADFLPGVMDQVSLNGMTYGYPVTVSPAVLWYDTEKFEQANVPSPEQSQWNIDAFRDALDTLRATTEDPDDPVFRPEQYGNTYLLMLIAAYGGVPYDYSTDPATLNFTDPATQDAVQQVLDMAKSGLIDYNRLVSNSFGFGGGDTAPIFDDTLTSYSWRMQNRNNTEFGMENLRLTNFPSGSQYTPVAFGVGAIYIRNTAQNPEACYKFMQAVASRPDLFGGMPARRSLLADSDVAVAQGDDIITLYQEFAAKLDQPNVINMPSAFSGGGSSSPGAFIEPYFINLAFDNYVLEDMPLDQVLNDTQANILAYRECTAPIPMVDTSEIDTPEASRTYYRQFAECAVALADELRPQLEWYFQEEE